MPQVTRLAVCTKSIGQCGMLRVYTVWKKVKWKKGKKVNDRYWTVLDNTSKQRFHFNTDDFHSHFNLLDKDFEPSLWKKIQAYDKKKAP